MGTIVGSTFRNALVTRFSGTSYGYIDNPSFKSNTQGALSFWSFPTSILTANGFNALISYGDTSAANNSLMLISQRWNSFVGSYPRPEILTRATHNGTFNGADAAYVITSAWRHNVIQTDGSVWQWYVNGTLQSIDMRQGTNTGDWFGDISGTNHRLVFGASYNTGVIQAYGENRQDEIGYWNRPLTSGEVTALYNGGAPMNPHRIGFGSEWISWWRMGDSRDDATTIYDERGSNNLTLVGSPSYVSP